MSSIIVDSDILIDFTRGDETAADWLDDAKSRAMLAVSSITEMEVIIGSRDKHHLKEILFTLTRFQIINISEQISIRASELVTKYCLSHRLRVPDALIAASALTVDVSLATINQKDFRFIDGLRLEQYP